MSYIGNLLTEALFGADMLGELHKEKTPAEKR